MENAPICINCKNYKKNGSCTAFLIIPSEIWSEGSAHDKPTAEQKNKIIFKPIK